MALFWDLTKNDFCFVNQNWSLLVKRRRWFDHWCSSSKHQLQMFSWVIRREGLCSRDAGGSNAGHHLALLKWVIVVNLCDKLHCPCCILEMLDVSAFRNSHPRVRTSFWGILRCSYVSLLCLCLYRHELTFMCWFSTLNLTGSHILDTGY